jgi:hypothetical protein
VGQHSTGVDIVESHFQAAFEATKKVAESSVIGVAVSL